MTKYYLAYGSNLNIEEMKSRCPFAKLVGSTIIPNYRLAFKGTKQIAYLTIEPCEGSIVPVGIYEITEVDEANLDYYEGIPTLYSKQNIKVTLNNQEIEAIVYIMNPIYSYNIPSNRYLNRCIEGYNNFHFSIAYLKIALENTTINIAKELINKK